MHARLAKLRQDDRDAYEEYLLLKGATDRDGLRRFAENRSAIADRDEQAVGLYDALAAEPDNVRPLHRPAT
ncbi:hypothetical protein [Streptomyces sp. NPDC002067]